MNPLKLKYILFVTIPVVLFFPLAQIGPFAFDRASSIDAAAKGDIGQAKKLLKLGSYITYLPTSDDGPVPAKRDQHPV